MKHMGFIGGTERAKLNPAKPGKWQETKNKKQETKFKLINGYRRKSDKKKAVSSVN